MTRRRTLSLATLALGTALAASGALAAEECAKGPVTVGFLPKLDTDPYFQVARTGAEEAQGEIRGKVVQQAPSQATAEAQIEFINMVIEHLTDQGMMDPELLYEPPFTGIAPTGPEHLFDEAKVVRLVTKIKAINDSAVA